jgi:hypothetical protein
VNIIKRCFSRRCKMFILDTSLGYLDRLFGVLAAKEIGFDIEQLTTFVSDPRVVPCLRELNTFFQGARPAYNLKKLVTICNTPFASTKLTGRYNLVLVKYENQGETHLLTAAAALGPGGVMVVYFDDTEASTEPEIKAVLGNVVDYKECLLHTSVLRETHRNSQTVRQSSQLTCLVFAARS